ncbi:flagellar basal body-associated protein FliL [Saccharobesus litoralis]|uniref:Flagellar protein FliL n=1 Tax=Saccharobesus litoralis TaxID=2172099 RepID=A0A2S0VX20_9ALTE|nr:flagellar basal body-associated protein FliL [Saccharobesus litoralis]AWB68660.1 flagellar basal body-associated protein FliL [Saccharobesus litoralis]
MIKSVKWLILTWLLVLVPTSYAEDSFGYFGMEPDITTNYISNKKKPGFVRITIELMLKNAENIDVVEHHEPVLRDAIITIIGRESEDKVKSLTGREEIRKKCADQVKLILKRETKDEIIHDLLFTKYIYH